MAVTPPPVEVSRLYHTEFVRSARAVAVLWASCTLCLAVLQVVLLVEPAWVRTTQTQPQGPAGTLGLYQVCVQSDWLVPECRGSLLGLIPIPAFQSSAVLVLSSLVAIWTSVACLTLFGFCNTATVYKICAWLQLTAGFCLALACIMFPDSWECAEMRALCGDRVSSFHPGSCSVHWAYVLAVLGVLDAAILSTLAFVLANRQDALLPPDKEVTAGLMSA